MKLNINSARKGNSSYTFSPLSLVSLDFGRLQPVQCWSTILGQKESVSGKGLLRCTPQVFPPFGRMNLKSASFFVPDSQLFSWSSAFHSDNKLWRGQIADCVPQINSGTFNYFFQPGGLFMTNLSTVVATNPASEPSSNTYDFTYPFGGTRTAGTTNLIYYKLTAAGWKVYAIFKSLGYDFVVFPTDTTPNSLATELAANTSMISLVPFLAYCKVWNDFFCNSYQSDNNIVSNCLQNIYLNKDISIGGVSYYDSSTFTGTSSLLRYMLASIHVPFETNMYTNAWNNVNDPTGVENANINQVNSQSLISPYGRNDVGEFGSLSIYTTGNYHDSTITGNKAFFSELGHKTLEAFDKFVRRRNLVGSKAVQQLYAMFGIEPDEWSKDYVVKLSENSQRINFSAITSQSDTETGSSGKPLGAFAGIGLGGFDINFNYNAGSYGTIICLAWLNIDPILMHGIHPDVLRVKPLDFYNPDWDGKAYRPIPYCEITGGKSIDSHDMKSISVYGYTNMYDDYRHMRDVVAGTFLDDTTKHFAFMRDLGETRKFYIGGASDMKPQTTEVQYWHNDGSSDITNPFLTDASLGDRFWFCIDWNIKSTRPILSSENSFDLDGEGSVTIKKNGDGLA